MDYPMALPPVPAAVTAARLLVRDVVAQIAGLKHVDDAEPVVSEMMTAALACTLDGPGEPPVHLILRLEASRLQIEVGADQATADDRSAEIAEYGVQLLTAAADDVEQLTNHSGANVRRIELRPPTT